MQWRNAYTSRFLNTKHVFWKPFLLNDVPKFKRGEVVDMLTFVADGRAESFEKQPGELVPLSVDFGEKIEDDESISLIDSTVVAYDDNNDDVSSTILSGSPSLENDTLQQDIKAGTTVGEYFKIVFTAKTGGAATDHSYQKTLHMVVDY